MKIAVIGSGIAGLSCAWLLSRRSSTPPTNERRQVTLFEQADYLGGHTNTIDVTLEGRTHPVDTGFLVLNDWTYPNLNAMFSHLGVTLAPSDMSFGIKLLNEQGRSRLEWCGSDRLSSVFAQPSNAFKPAFWGMLTDLLRFNREATALADSGGAIHGTLGEYLAAHRYGAAFRDWYLKPMAACIWSTPTQRIDQFPLATFLSFCRNHGLLSVNQRPQWRTVKGGARAYVQKLAATLSDIRLNAGVVKIHRDAQGVTVMSAAGAERFDQLVLACHSDQALALLADANTGERQTLGAIPYQANTAILHTDLRFLPDRPRAWAAWNYMARDEQKRSEKELSIQSGASPVSSIAESPVSLSYLINRLQPLPFQTPVIVTMNPLFAPDPAKVIKTMEYHHPVFLAESTTAKRALRTLQGQHRTWFAGAWTRYGFHEDGLMSGIAVAKALGAEVPWHSNVPAANDLTQSYPGVDV